MLHILKKLKMSPINLIRKNETIWKQIYAEISMNNQELLNAMILHPKLIQRPIVELENGAVITCLTENIKDLL
jgi:arsenate reductase